MNFFTSFFKDFSKSSRRNYLLAMMCFFLIMYLFFPSVSSTQVQGPASHEGAFKAFSLFSDPRFKPIEVYGLLAILCVALMGLLYALLLVTQVRKADKGTPKMQMIAAAVREGANAYLSAQFKKIGPLIVLVTIFLYFSYTGAIDAFRWGRAGAFLVGALFSGLVGFIGMRLATEGNLRVAAAAKRSYGEALQLGYRTGTITGMLTDGLGLLGGTMIFIIFGEQAYEALLGFGFGGTLLALFMRVGGGIYTKAADVGADLVGKLEKDIPEDDPRNAATIADNVGDNVGDCAGMAADIFESYEVTIVAAMILGHGELRPQGRHLPPPRPGHRGPGLHRQHLHGEGRSGRYVRHGPEERPQGLLDRLHDQHRGIRDSRILLPPLRRPVPRWATPRHPPASPGGSLEARLVRQLRHPRP